MISNIFSSINKFAGSPALITDEGELISYGDLTDISDKIGNAVDKRCVVLCICSNNSESISGYIGFLRNGIVPILVHYGANITGLNNLLEAYRPRFIYLPKAIAINYPEWKGIYEYRKYILLLAPYDVSYPIHEELALLLTTSGSTGSPKLVRQSLHNIISNAISIVKYLNITQADRPITTLPMSYTYGLSIINSHLLMGATILLTDKTLLEKEFWQFLRKYEATTFGGVPYIYTILKKLRFERMNLHTIKIITQAGGRLGLDLSREFAKICAEKGIQFVVMYGQTEATARISYLPPEYAMCKAGSIGIAIPGGELLLIDERGEIIRSNDIAGELVYKGPNVTLGYSETYKDLKKGDENCGVLKTGDIAKRDRDGFYYIVGRKKRFLKLFGNRINLDEVENLLTNAGFDCACAGMDDSMIIYTSGDDTEIIRVYVMEHTSVNPNGFIVKKAETIPRNESGKILYSALK